MSVAKILWVDDEIESLRSQKLFLENKGYEVETLTNGFDAVEFVKENAVDVVLMDESMQQKLNEACLKLNISKDEGRYFVFTGEAVNTMYKTNDEHINILFKDGVVKDISQVDNALIHKTLSSAIKKFYICFYQ